MTRHDDREQRAQSAVLALLQQTATGEVAFTAPSNLPMEIAPGVFWLGSCLVRASENDEVHSGASAYLVVGSSKCALIDTGHKSGWPLIAKQLEQCLDGRQLDYVIPTHAEMPHGGNVGALLTKYPSAVAIGDMRDYHLYFPEVADRLRETPVGEVIELGTDHAVRLVDAVLRDMPNTVWAYEEHQRVLFVADGFAYLHHPELMEDAVGLHTATECGQLADRGAGFPTLEDIRYYCSAAFYWARFRSDSDEFFDRLEALMAECPTSVIAPSHGNVITDLERVVPLAREAHAQAFEGYTDNS